MSAFKRYQSKVFWGQMASQDLGFDRFNAQAELPRFKQNFLPEPIELPEKEEEEEEEEEQEVNESSGGCNEHDTVDGQNITAIHVCQNINNRSETTSTTAACENDENNAMSENRCCSPLSQDLRSQDSGFSDSERSNCSELYENETPRRRRRRSKTFGRKSERQRKIHGRIGNLWLDEDILPNPSCTSTPKDTRIYPGIAFGVRATSGQSFLNLQQRKEGQADTGKIISSVSFEEESLGDYLYAAEPPEDPIKPKSVSSLVNQTQADVTLVSTASGIPSRNSCPVRSWLNYLAVDIENECTSTLQSKNLPRRKHGILSEKDEMKDLKTLSSLATAAANKLLVTAEHFDRHYRNIFDKVAHLEGGRSEKELLRTIEDNAFAVLSELGAPPPRRIQQSSLKGTLVQLESMKSYVDGVVDTRLDFYIEKVVRGLEEAPKDDTTVARGALAALTALGLVGSRAGSSIARCCGIRALLTSLITGGRTSTDFVAASLRALASVCSCPIAIDCFARDGGPEILADLLMADSTPEGEKTEATALIVQITAPWTKAFGLPYLEPFANSLIPSLNRLVENTCCGQTLLLVAAALNNLSKSKRCRSLILQYDTVRNLLKSVKKSTGKNVWLMEQVASLIGELARIPEARPYLAKARASVALVSFLRMRPPGLEGAYRRLEITAAAALTRLCVHPEIARQVVAVGGTDCLPSCTIEDLLTEDEEEIEAGLLRYTKSLRRACKRAAKQIDIAKASDYSAY